MTDIPGTDTPLPPPTTTSVRTLQPRRLGSSSGSRSRTTSRASSRAASLRPSETALRNDARSSARNSLSPPAGHLKRGRSTDDEGDEADPFSTSLHGEENGEPSAKRRRPDTESVEELLADDCHASSSLLAGPSEPLDSTNEPESHAVEPSTHVGEAMARHGTDKIDAASSEEESSLSLISSSSSQSSASSSKRLDASQLDTTTTQPSKGAPPAKPLTESLASYNCPICFSPPRYATLTPCGHICCGECLFTAVKATIERAQFHGPASQNAKSIASTQASQARNFSFMTLVSSSYVLVTQSCSITDVPYAELPSRAGTRAVTSTKQDNTSPPGDCHPTARLTRPMLQVACNRIGTTRSCPQNRAAASSGTRFLTSDAPSLCAIAAYPRTWLTSSDNETHHGGDLDVDQGCAQSVGKWEVGGTDADGFGHTYPHISYHV
ncbi:hypothetical protein NM688_g3300 [Phlebia brevispora]|uniref:Uncharacterized protein n=1 Tax=Phlebia brevispora TaxID=194682 RepID=A0ACC1T5X9_9APHY|nr:hypothetical protein NM688_g3300 [Phlebia brevispora]